MLVEEGGAVRLTVTRLQGSLGEVHVSWNITTDAYPDIYPVNGTITFDNVSMLVINANCCHALCNCAKARCFPS